MADYVANAAANHVPIFGVAGTVKLDGGSPGPFDGVSAKDWDIVSVAVNPGSDMVEHRNSVGTIKSRTHFNLDGAANQRSRSTTITITFIPIGTTAGAAATAGALITNGRKFKVESCSVPGADGIWEVTGCSPSGTNTENVSVTLNGVWAVDNT